MTKPSKKHVRFVGIPHKIASTDKFAKLKGNELKLLIELLRQFNGRNNGNLTTAESILSKRGWAASSIYYASTGLQRQGWIVITRQGWKVRGMATLVAITWEGIDDPPKGVKNDEGISVSPVPLSYWCKHPDTWGLIPRCLQKNSSKAE